MIKMYDLAGADPEHRFSPYCWRVRLALAHKGLSVETIPWRYHEEKIAFSGQGFVPVLVDGDIVVSDSWRIARYLDEAYPKSKPPFTVAGSVAKSLFIKHWMGKVVHPVVSRVIIPEIIKQVHPLNRDYFRNTREQRFGMRLEDLSAERDKNLQSLHASFEVLRATLGEFQFLGGSEADFSDYLVFAAFQWARCVSQVKLFPEGDLLEPWLDRMLKMFDGMAQKARRYT
jgi:glutathione S-transferase